MPQRCIVGTFTDATKKDMQMMANHNPGLQHRFRPFGRALSLLQQCTESSNLSVVERAGLIHFFEISCKLGLDLLKEYLEGDGYIFTTESEVVECAVSLQLLKDVEGWFTLLQGQRMTQEIFEEATARILEENIRMKYFPLLAQLHHEFSILMKEKGK